MIQTEKMLLFSRSVMSNSLWPHGLQHCQASLSFTDSWSLLKLLSIESVMPSNHLILCCPLLLLPSMFPSIKISSNESALRIKWPKYWSFSFSISPSNEYFFRIDWLINSKLKALNKKWSWIKMTKQNKLQSLGVCPSLAESSGHLIWVPVSSTQPGTWQLTSPPERVQRVQLSDCLDPGKCHSELLILPLWSPSLNQNKSTRQGKNGQRASVEIQRLSHKFRKLWALLQS